MSQHQLAKATIIGVGLALAACSAPKLSQEQVDDINSRIDPLCSDPTVQLDRQSVFNCHQQFNSARNDVNYIIVGSQRDKEIIAAQEKGSTKDKFLSWVPGRGGDEDQQLSAQETLPEQSVANRVFSLNEVDLIVPKHQMVCHEVTYGNEAGFYTESNSGRSVTYDGLTFNPDTGDQVRANDAGLPIFAIQYIPEIDSKLCFTRSQDNGFVRAYHVQPNLLENFSKEVTSSVVDVVKGAAKGVYEHFQNPTETRVIKEPAPVTQ